MENENDDYSCELYTTAGTDYKAIKESLHIDYDAVWKEAEEILTVEKLKPDDRKLKSKRGTKICKGKGKSELPDTELSKNRTCEEVPVTEQPNDCQTRRSRRQRTGATKRGAATNASEALPKHKHVIGPIVIVDSPERPAVTNDHISLSSDSETEMNVSAFEDVNYEVSVKVWWKFERFDKFVIRRFQKISSLFDHYSKLENVPQSQVLLTLNDVQVHPNDSPDSLKLTAASVLEGGVTTCGDVKNASDQVKYTLNVDEMELKVQRKGYKEPILIRISKTQKMRVLMLKCAECVDLPAEKLKFSFDGEFLNPNETPVDLDLEGGECIDLYISEI